MAPGEQKKHTQRLELEQNNQKSRPPNTLNQETPRFSAASLARTSATQIIWPLGPGVRSSFRLPACLMFSQGWVPEWAEERIPQGLKPSGSRGLMSGLKP
jgi:hypothetical protein